MNMTKIKATIQIEATQDTVWQTVKDIGNIADFHPLVKHSHTTNQVVGIGAERSKKGPSVNTFSFDLICTPSCSSLLSVT